MFEPKIQEFKSLKAVGNNVILELDGLVNITPSGIIKSDNGDQAAFGTVISFGSTVKELSIGDHVHFNKNSGLKVRVNDKLCKIVDPHMIYAVLY